MRKKTMTFKRLVRQYKSIFTHLCLVGVATLGATLAPAAHATTSDLVSQYQVQGQDHLFATNTIDLTSNSPYKLATGQELILGGFTDASKATKDDFMALESMMKRFSKQTGFMINVGGTHTGSINGEDSYIVVGNYSGNQNAKKNIYLGSDSLTIVNFDDSTTSSPLVNWTANVDSGAKLLITGVREATTYKVVGTVRQNQPALVANSVSGTPTSIQGWTGDNLQISNGFFQLQSSSVSGSYTFKQKNAIQARGTYFYLTDDEYKLFNLYGTQTAKSSEVNLVNRLLDSSLSYNEQQQQMSSVGRVAQVGGVNQAALLTTKLSSQALDERIGTLAQTESTLPGVGIWVAPTYISSSSSDLDAGLYKYGQDITLAGGVLGIELKRESGFTGGITFTVGKGSSDSQGGFLVTKNDFNTYGIGAYASLDRPKYRLNLDAAYHYATNKVEQAENTGGTLNADIDAQVFTLGATGIFKIQTSIFDVLPHVGVRYTMVNTSNFDAYEGATLMVSGDSTKQNLFEVPVGITVAKEFVGAKVKVKPALDLSLVGFIGDTSLDSQVKVANVDASVANLNYSAEIVDPIAFRANLGVATQAGAFEFGVSLNFTGAASSSSTSLLANAKYTF